ncbi:MAG: biopolymer transporter ExbD [Prevotella sp.]|nr:biopolymer transporter ExbD [Prevotella sp.]
MGKVKIKKQDVWIDMTPMSDVMVLLLTFFMMTATFVSNEPVKVIAPQSISEIKVPESNVLNIVVDSVGNVFMSMDNRNEAVEALRSFSDKFGIELTKEMELAFRNDPQWGVAVNANAEKGKYSLAQYLKLPDDQRASIIVSQGIPTDSIDNGDGTKTMSEFQAWVKSVRETNRDIRLAIDGAYNTPYTTIKKIMSELQDMSENRYFLKTQYKQGGDE